MRNPSDYQTGLMCHESGEGFPLVFGHSYLWDAAMWTPQVNLLQNSFRCIVPEVWGHGESPNLSASDYSLDQLAQDHIQALDRRGVDSFAAIGLSLGGMWAARLALMQPERVNALVLMNTYVGAEPPENQELYLTMLDTVEQVGAFPEVMVNQILPLFFSPVTLSERPHLVEPFKNRLLAMPAETVQTLVTIGRGLFSRESLLDQLPTLNVPTLIIAGEDDRARPVDEAREMAELIPGAQLVIVGKAGHISSLEEPEAVTDLLLPFLRTHIHP